MRLRILCKRIIAPCRVSFSAAVRDRATCVVCVAKKEGVML